MGVRVTPLEGGGWCCHGCSEQGKRLCTPLLWVPQGASFLLLLWKTTTILVALNNSHYHTVLEVRSPEIKVSGGLVPSEVSKADSVSLPFLASRSHLHFLLHGLSFIFKGSSVASSRLSPVSDLDLCFHHHISLYLWPFCLPHNHHCD